jgi:hypothetical protein
MRNHDLGVECQQRRNAVGGGRGVAQIAGKGRAVLDLDAADLPRCRLQPVECGRKRGGDNVAPGCGGPEAPAAFRSSYSAQGLDAGDVDEAVVQRCPAAGRKDIGSAGQQNRPVLAHQLQRFIKVAGGEIGPGQAHLSSEFC